ncbi:hypothetical protein Trydic_g23040 [Trypoxylus dichotomus]
MSQSFITEWVQRYGNTRTVDDLPEQRHFANLYETARQRGIQVQYTIPYTPQQNGVSERMNRTLMDKVRTKFAETNLPKELWGEAIQCSAYELNRSPTKANNGIVPAAIWYDNNIDLEKLKQEDPKTYKDAAQDKEWNQAIEKRFQTWEKTGLPKGRKAIETRWVKESRTNCKRISGGT